VRKSCWIKNSQIVSIANLILLTASCPSVAVPSQEPHEAASIAYSPQLLAELKQIQQAALASDYAFKQLTVLTNKIGPRLSGSVQAQNAVDYVASELRRLGLDVRLEKVLVPHWIRGEEKAELVKFPGQMSGMAQRIVLTTLGGSVATPATGLTAEVVTVDSFEELEALGRANVEGKIVLFNRRFDKQMAAQGFGLEAYRQIVPYRTRGPSAAARLGAVAALVRSAGGSNYRLPHAGFTRYAKDAARIPAAALTGEDADLIAGLSKEGPVRLQLTLTAQTLPDALSYNVVADLKGSEHPEQVVIVSGHLDSWDLGTGAIDDGAGVVMAMETVQVLQELNLRPKRSIRFIAWMGEEFGGIGGTAYAKDHQAELADHFAAIESDHGAGHPLGFSIKARQTVRPILEPVTLVLQDSGAGLTRLTEEIETDISPLADAGVPCFGLWQDGRTYFNYHHTAADTLDKVAPKELAENVAVMAVLAYALANLSQPLPR
jgi:carboxypeptidase Q